MKDFKVRFMICDFCKKNIAVIHIEKQAGDKHVQIRVCGECAGLQGLTPENLNEESLQKLIADLKLLSPPQPAVTCGTCGMSSADLVAGSKLGCEDCYRDLRGPLDLGRWQRTVHFKHLGRVPEGLALGLGEESGFSLNLERMKEDLTRCISDEDYEQAAILRDKISVLEEALHE